MYFRKVVHTTIAVIAAFILGRWSSPRTGAAAKVEAEPWVMITEACERSPQEGRGQGIPGGQPVTRDVASQAPCTYTIVRGHAKGRFLPLPEAAHG